MNSTLTIELALTTGKTPEELIELAKDEGITLTEEQIEKDSGGLDLISIAVK